MRNLKRVLSLALSAVMLLGLMVMGAGAANVGNFNDSDEIQHMEAAGIVAGLDIFSGNELGEFDPDGRVTRAMMATIICKILHGSDVNVSIYEGIGKFSDTVGNYAWAEGWTTMCSTLGIVNGYPDGRYGVDDTVLAWQAAYMLERALGYWLPGDPSQGDQLSVMKTASEIGLFGDLNVKSNDQLTRDQVAEMVFHALFAQQVRWSTDRNNYVKSNDEKVAVVAGTKDETNTLARNVFGLYAVDGLVTENGYTNILLKDKTTVVFEDAKDVTGDNKAETEWSFEYATGLDFIGHASTVYYRIVRKAPQVFAIVDKAEKVEVTTLGDNLSTTARNAGFSRDTGNTAIVYNYNLDDELAASDAYTNNKDDAVILIANSSDLTVDYAIVVDQELDFVKKTSVNKADKDNPITTYSLEDLGSKTEEQNVVAVGEVEQYDWVIVTQIKDRDTTGKGILYVIQPARTEQETLVKVTRQYNTTRKLASAAVEYGKSPVTVLNDLLSTGSIEDQYAVTPYAAVLSKGEYILIFDEFFDKLIGVAPVEVDNTVNYAYVAQFGHKINTDASLNDKYALTAHVYWADGTNGIYTVDTSWAGESNAFRGRVNSNEKWDYNTASLGTNVELSTSREWISDTTKDCLNAITFYANNLSGVYANKNGVLGDSAKKGAIGLYNVTLQDNGKVRIGTLTDAESAPTKFDTIRKGVTYMGDNGAADGEYYGSSKTVLFFVNGLYNETASGYGITVGVATGMANIPNIGKAKGIGGDTTKPASDSPIKGLWVNAAAPATDGYGLTAPTDDDALVAQAFYTQKTGYRAVDTALVAGYEMFTVKEGIYFYNGEYTTTKNSGKWDLDITVYDNKTGEEKVLTYTGYSSDSAARNAVKDVPVGFYTDSGKSSAPLAEYANENTEGDPRTDLTLKAHIVYAHSSTFERFTERGDVLTLYTNTNQTQEGVIATDAQVIDLTGNKLASLEAMNDLIDARQEVYENAGVSLPSMKTAIVAYSYDEDNNTAEYIYIIKVIKAYGKDYTGTGNGDEDAENVEELADTLSGNTITVNYVDGDEDAFDATREFLASLGYKMSEYKPHATLGTAGTVTGTHLSSGVSREFALVQHAFYKVTVDDKLVAYIRGAQGGSTVDATVDLAKKSGDIGLGYIGDAAADGTYAYATYGSVSLTGVDHHVEYSKGYVGFTAPTYTAGTALTAAVITISNSEGAHDYVRANSTFTVTLTAPSGVANSVLKKSTAGYFTSAVAYESYSVSGVTGTVTDNGSTKTIITLPNGDDAALAAGATITITYKTAEANIATFAITATDPA